MDQVKFRFPTSEAGSYEEVVVEGYEQLNILAHAQLAERSLQSRCGGQCECSTCRVVLVSGKLSPMQAEENALLKKVRALDGKTRLACQAFPDFREGQEVVLEVPKSRFSDAREGK